MCEIPKKHLASPTQRPIGDVEHLLYSAREGLTYTFAQTAHALSKKGVVTDITATAGDGFFNFTPHNEGDAKPTFTNGQEFGDDGSFDRNIEFTVIINNDTPETRDLLDNLVGKKIDLLVIYKGECGYKWEVMFDVELRTTTSSEKRRTTCVFRKTNPQLKPMLLYKTDFDTTAALVETITEG